jgi:hypothetical protein
LPANLLQFLGPRKAVGRERFGTSRTLSLVERPSADGRLHNSAFSPVVVASGTRTTYTAGQVSVDEHGALVGAGDLAA